MLSHFLICSSYVIYFSSKTKVSYGTTRFNHKKTIDKTFRSYTSRKSTVMEIKEKSGFVHVLSMRRCNECQLVQFYYSWPSNKISLFLVMSTRGNLSMLFFIPQARPIESIPIKKKIKKEKQGRGKSTRVHRSERSRFHQLHSRKLLRGFSGQSRVSWSCLPLVQKILVHLISVT